MTLRPNQAQVITIDSKTLEALTLSISPLHQNLTTIKETSILDQDSIHLHKGLEKMDFIIRLRKNTILTTLIKIHPQDIMILLMTWLV